MKVDEEKKEEPPTLPVVATPAPAPGEPQPGTSSSVSHVMEGAFHLV